MFRQDNEGPRLRNVRCHERREFFDLAFRHVRPVNGEDAVAGMNLVPYHRRAPDSRDHGTLGRGGPVSQNDP